MNLLLDTYALIWWVEDSSKLSMAAVEAIENAEGRVAFSAASIWEIATKLRIGKLRMRRGLGDAVSDLTRRAGSSPWRFQTSTRARQASSQDRIKTPSTAC